MVNAGDLKATAPCQEAAQDGHSALGLSRTVSQSDSPSHTPAYRYGTLVNQACEASKRIIEEAGKGRRLPGGKA